MAIRRIVVGTFNRGKAREIVGLLQGLGVPVLSLGDFPAVSPVEERGETFAENAAQKALGLAQQLHEAVLAEDSGLEVDALGGRPGVLSARYGGQGLSDAQRVERLLEEMKDVPDGARTARFRCVAVLADEEKVRATATGSVEGRIARRPAGSSGFGYDPVFIPEGCDRSFAELGVEVKQRLSHRARAMAALRRKLAEPGL